MNTVSVVSFLWLARSAGASAATATSPPVQQTLPNQNAEVAAQLPQDQVMDAHLASNMPIVLKASSVQPANIFDGVTVRPPPGAVFQDADVAGEIAGFVKTSI